ncbi:Beta-alanine--pyruvate aminotransferase [Acetobacteraceae bacterium EV16G]|uniref:Beta-alanine--pyruvate aminotransferase n=1 Tax=Sorlinia euscelidii TaxID=3081148 RepID=A0ABU7U5Q4_9PROT
MQNTAIHGANRDALWLPFTAHRQFRQAPRVLISAKGMYYKDAQGQDVLDGCAGLWCVNAGHTRTPIVEAIQREAAKLDFAPTFQMAHPLAFEAAGRISALTPPGLDHIFFCNSGSEAADTALKIAIAYHRANGRAERSKIVGRERGYHGVGLGGLSVGGISSNRKQFGPLLADAAHLPHTYDPSRNAFSRGLPKFGAEYADALEKLFITHDPSTIAAVMVEPMSGSAGVLLPPVGYLKRLREICDKHGILLIFDEVITGFGRLGASFAAEKYQVRPDIMTMAKGLTNGAIPMGAVAVKDTIFTGFMQGPEAGIELPHGYTYSAHPVACAAAIATLNVYRDERLFERAAALAPYFEDAAHSLKDAPHVIDIRNEGLVAGIEIAPGDGEVSRIYKVFDTAFRQGVLLRCSGNTLSIAPPLIIEKNEIDRIFETIRRILITTS